VNAAFVTGACLPGTQVISTQPCFQK